MARIAFVALAVVAVLAAVVAGGPPPAPNNIQSWLQDKQRQLLQWGQDQKQNLQNQWQTKVLPQVLELKNRLGAEWQEKGAPVVALLKAKTGAAFDKAVSAVNGMG